MTQADKAKLFLSLHRTERPLVLPNAWDAASARIFEEAGFPAIATTSAGIANALGYQDGERVSLGEMLEVVGRIARAVKVPVTADMEAGYGDAGATARGVIEAGAVGFNLEDKNDAAAECEGIAQARRESAELGVHVVVNARIDLYLYAMGKPVDEALAVQRLRAYAEAGADCVFVPGLNDAATIHRLVEAVDRPLNILATAGSPSIARLRELGVERVSIGSGAMRATMGLTARIAHELRKTGGIQSMVDGAISFIDANRLFGPIPGE